MNTSSWLLLSKAFSKKGIISSFIFIRLDHKCWKWSSFKNFSKIYMTYGNAQLLQISSLWLNEHPLTHFIQKQFQNIEIFFKFFTISWTKNCEICILSKIVGNLEDLSFKDSFSTIYFHDRVNTPSYTLLSFRFIDFYHSIQDIKNYHVIYFHLIGP